MYGATPLQGDDRCVVPILPLSRFSTAPMTRGAVGGEQKNNVGADIIRPKRLETHLHVWADDPIRPFEGNEKTIPHKKMTQIIYR